MCDPTAIISDTIAGASGKTLPWRQGTVGSTLGSVGRVGGSLFDIVREGRAADEQQEAIGKRSAQIAFDSKLTREQISEMADRRIGGQRGRIAKAGLKASGTTRQLLEEQIKQDELELLRQSISTDVSLNEERKASRRVSQESSARMAKSLSGTLFGLDV